VGSTRLLFEAIIFPGPSVAAGPCLRSSESKCSGWSTSAILSIRLNWESSLQEPVLFVRSNSLELVLVFVLVFSPPDSAPVVSLLEELPLPWLCLPAAVGFLR